jgi:hypothetical protein
LPAGKARSCPWLREQPKEMRMVTAPPRHPAIGAADPPIPGSVAAAPGAAGLEPPAADGFVVEWQLAGGAGRDW